MYAFTLSRRVTDYFDKLTDSLTTFRLVLYILLTYLVAAAAFDRQGRFGFGISSLLFSTLVLVIVSKVANLGLAKIFAVPANHESDIITGLILSFILTPAKTTNEYLILVAAAVVAMTGKYILAFRGRHIFNPAAFAVFVTGVVFHQYASWWIGSKAMAPILLLGGFIIVRKMRRFQLVLSFAALYLIYQLIMGIGVLQNGVINWQLLSLYLFSTPLIFFASIMLTEPLTSPTQRDNLLIFSTIVFATYSITGLHRPPEEALLMGNLAAFFLEPNRSLLLKLVGRRQEAAGIFSFFFQAPARLNYHAGQYMEWTIPHTGIDARGNRRYLTIASAPTEKKLMFTIKIPTHHSKYKEALLGLKPGQKIAATRLTGTFTLSDSDQKIAFIAGGVGITPFRSIIKDLIDKRINRDIKLFYSANTASEMAFTDLFSEAQNFGLETFYVTTKGVESNCLHGQIDASFIRSHLKDYQNRLFYISGPQGFVAAVRLALLELGIHPTSIKTDYFPGYN